MMGVIGERKDPYTPGVEDDAFELIEQGVEAEEQQPQQPVSPSTPRRAPKSAPVLIHRDQRSPKKCNGVRQRRRLENLNLLMSLVEPEEVELLRPSLVEPSTSPLTELFLDREKMKIWNKFISCTEEEQEGILCGSLEASGCVATPAIAGQDTAAAKQEENLLKDWEVIDKDDKRTVHPAFAAEVCYRRIDTKLRVALKKRHVPQGILEYLENELMSFFSEWPGSVYISQLNSSYERLLLHALCQYLDLHAHSFGDQGMGKRRTQVENRHSIFVPPSVPLSKFLHKPAH